MGRPAKSIPEQTRDAHDAAIRRLELHERRIALPTERQHTARNYLDGIRDRLTKRQAAYLDALVPLLRHKHYRAITQQGLAKRANWTDRSMRSAQAELEAAGIIHVTYQYRPSRSNHGKPSRKASIVWLIGYTKDFARYIEGKVFDDIPPHEILAHLRPETRLLIGPKIPGFIQERKGGFIQERDSAYLCFVVPTKSPGPGSTDSEANP